MGSQKRTVLCHWGWIVTLVLPTGNCFNSLAPSVGTSLYSFFINKKKPVLVHIRATDPGRNNPPPEAGDHQTTIL